MKHATTTNNQPRGVNMPTESVQTFWNQEVVDEEVDEVEEDPNLSCSNCGAIMWADQGPDSPHSDNYECQQCGDCEECHDCNYCNHCEEFHCTNVDFCHTHRHCAVTCENDPDLAGECENSQPKSLLKGEKANPLETLDFAPPRQPQRPYRLQPQVYWGIEIELNARSVEREEALEGLFNEAGSWAIFKRDLSLSSTNGFEFCTSPLSYKYMLGNLKGLGRGLSKYAKGWGRPNYGIHIHVSRNFLTPQQLVKMYIFLHHRMNRGLVEHIAHRRNARWAQYDNHIPVQTKRVTAHLKNIHHNQGEKANIVNLRHPDTVEFRMFQSATKIDRIISYFEFIQCLKAYVSTIHLSESELTHQRTLRNSERFVDYVNTQSTQYPMLHKYIHMQQSSTNCTR